MKAEQRKQRKKEKAEREEKKKKKKKDKRAEAAGEFCKQVSANMTTNNPILFGVVRSTSSWAIDICLRSINLTLSSPTTLLFPYPERMQAIYW